MTYVFCIKWRWILSIEVLYLIKSSLHPLLFKYIVNEDIKFSWDCWSGKSYHVRFSGFAPEGHQVTCCRQRWMQDSSTQLLSCHCFSGSLHQPSSLLTRHHSSRTVWQMAAVLTPLELDNKQDFPTWGHRATQGNSWCPSVAHNKVNIMWDRVTACHCLNWILKEIKPRNTGGYMI